MSACDQVRQRLGLPKGECCDRCHERNELETLVLVGVGEVRVCCTVAALTHPSQLERPTRPYGLDDPDSSSVDCL